MQDKLGDNSQMQSFDLFSVNDNGYTLIMLASEKGSLQSLEFLLEQQRPPIDAQHNKVGSRLKFFVSVCEFSQYSFGACF